MSDILAQPIAAIARSLRQGRVKAIEVVEAAIARHERFGALLNAYSFWAPDLARQAATAADAAFAAGAVAGPLQGIPISLKDLFAAAGMPCFAGSSKRLPPRWEEDGPLVATMRRQVAIFTGKTHMVEFAFGGTGTNSHWGTPRNPWDAEQIRSPGGSSSGAGVSLLEGSALLAFGSDTAGSVRIPASATGNVGLKVTLGRWSAEGVVPLSPSFDTPGILARSVADAAYGFAAIDPLVHEPAAFLHRVTRDIAGIRVGLADAALWNDCEPGIAEAVKDALVALGKAGALLREAPLPEASEAYGVFVEGGLSGIELRGLLELDLPDWLGQLDPFIAPGVQAAKSVSAVDYLSRLYRLRRLASRAPARFDAVDVIATPTLCIAPPLMSAVGGWEINRGLVRNTVPVNYLGLCAITLPVARDALGMPVGLQFIARAGAEETLLGVALAAERVLGTGADRLGAPPLLK